MSRLSIAIVCSSNMNRSMEAHALLARNGFKVKSFGTADQVRLLGHIHNNPNCYDFGTPYIEIYKDLVNKNMEFYTQTGILDMLARNIKLKQCPERLQDSTEMFDVIITCGELIFDKVFYWFTGRDSLLNKHVYLINIDIVDTLEGATIGSYLILELVKMISHSRDLGENLDDIIYYSESKFYQVLLNCVMMY